MSKERGVLEWFSEHVGRVEGRWNFDRDEFLRVLQLTDLEVAAVNVTRTVARASVARELNKSC